MKKNIYFTLFILSLLFVLNQKSHCKLIAYWSFDDKTTRDSTANHYDGTPMNNPTYKEGVCGGYAIHLQGEGYYSLAGNTPPGSHVILPQIDFAKMNEFSISLWVREERMSHAHGEAYIFFGHDNSGYLEIANEFNGTSQFNNNYTVGGTGLNNLISETFDMNLRNQWIHYCMIYKDGVLKAYHNCRLVGSKAMKVNISGPNGALGRHWWSFNGEERNSARFIGDIDEVKIFDYALSDSELAEICDYTINYSVEANKPLCEGDDIILNLKTNKPVTKVIWTGPNLFNSTLTNPIIKNATQNQSGEYEVTFVYCENVYKEKILVTILPYLKPEIYAPTGTDLCVCDSLPLNAKQGFAKYEWFFEDETNPFSNNSEIWVKKIGKYILRVTDINGCTGKDSINIVFLPPVPVILVNGRKVICEGDSVELELTGGPFASFIWYDDETGEVIDSTNTKIIVKRAGKYYVKVKSPGGCRGMSVIAEIKVSKNDLEIESFLDNGIFQFDSVYYPIMLCKPLKIKNISANNFILDNPFLFKNIAFSIPQSQLPISFAPGEEHELTICFSPTVLGINMDTLFVSDSCSEHVIPIQGFTPPNIYEGMSGCDVPVILKTEQLPFFFISAPYPNPAKNKITISFNGILQRSEVANLSCNLFNPLGIKAAAGTKFITTLNQNKTSCEHSGIFEINTEGLNSGYYFIVITANGKQYSRSVAVIK